MADSPNQRRLAAVLAADVAGYTRLMEKDTDGTVAAWQAACGSVIEPVAASHSGRLVKFTGDGFLAEFLTVQDAVRCAVAMQEGLADCPLEFRMGVNLGDIVDDGRDIHGEGVNVAARLEAMAQPGGICISGEVHAMVRNRVDYRFEDLGEHEVKHVTHPVRVFAIQVAAPSIAQAPAAQKPSIAVLPFDNLSGDPEQDYFTDGLTEDIIAELSRFQSFFVIARHSSFFYKGKPVTVQRVGRDLGVRYVVGGSVRKAGERVRVAVLLSDADSGNQIWSERYDHGVADLFDLQDEVTRAIVAAVPGRLESADLNRIKRKPPEDMAVYDYVLRGKMHHHRCTEDDNAEAIRLLDRAIELDPDFAEAYAWKACTLGQALARGFGDDKEDLFARDVAAVEKALSLDDNNFECHWIMCEVRMMVANLDEAELHHEKALVLNPNDPRVVAQRSELLTYLGRPEEGVEWARRAMRLNPYDAASRAHLLGRALYMTRRYDDAIEAFRHIRTPSFGHHAEIAACYAELGSDDKAKQHVAKVLELKPDFSIAGHLKNFPFSEYAARDQYAAGLRKAGLPEN